MMITDKKGILDKRWMNSRISSEDTTLKEKVFGYLIGPVGVLLFNTIINGYNYPSYKKV